jgi:hypothetical protein
MSGSITGNQSIRNLNEVLDIPRLKYDGIRVKIDQLENKELIIKDAYEIPDTKFGSNRNYIRMEIDIPEDGILKPATVNSSSKDIMQKVKQAKAQGDLPVRATLRKVTTKQGSRYYWILE